ncbi:BA71V-F1055L [Elysia marginata]|uniref:BA71V-F1055L n=1 Tax=Elysia marginata TaxID=1093978 RepID=A0AAV4H063_9GAST|nr:BA71V-F1055L [Elysia marginata]
MAACSHHARGFPFLKKGPGRAAADVLEANYRFDELETRPVIRDEYHRVYRVFPDWKDFWAWRDTIAPREQCFDEVIFGNAPQRLKFDIDAPGYKIDALSFSDVEAFTGKIGGRAAPSATHHHYEHDDDISALLADFFDTEEAPAAKDELQPNAGRSADNRQAKVDGIIDGLIEVIMDELQSAWYGLDSVAISRDDIIVMESSGPSGGDWKFSFHLLVAPYAVANNEEAKGFTARVLAQLPAAIHGFVDPQVNKSLQNFRLPGSSKPNTGRVKRITSRFGTAQAPREAAIVRASPRETCILTRLYTEESADRKIRLLDGEATSQAWAPELSGKDLQEVLDVVERSGASRFHTFWRARGDLLLFRRDAPSHCTLCGRTHDKDNTLMVAVEAVETDSAAAAAVFWPNPGAAKAPHRVVEHCRRANGTTETQARILGFVDIERRAPFNFADSGSSSSRGKVESVRRTASAVSARIAAIEANAVDVHLASASALEALPEKQKHVYAEPRMRAYESVPTLVIKGQMKLGKTKALRAYLDHYHAEEPGALRCPVVRMVTFRQAFSKSMQREVFKDFELYSDYKGDLDHVRFRRLIVQLESLWRLPMGEAPEPIDVLILDEVESILAQFNSGLHRRFNATFAMFQWMLATARQVICIDANVGDRTLHVLQKMRAAHPVHFHWNQYQRAGDDLYYFTADQSIWLDHLFESLRRGQRIVLPSNSLTEALAFEAAIRQRFPEKAVCLYSSRLSPSEKERHFADVHTHWSGLDALIYTPTVSAGVSYELERFDALFGYFTNMSCAVETCRQMLARVRSIATKKHYICLLGRKHSLPTATDDIRRLVHDKRTNLYRRLDGEGAQFAFQFEYGPNGDVRFHESSYFYLWLETVRTENLSKNDFVARFIDQVADTGAAVASLEALPGAGERLSAVKTSHRSIKIELAEAECRAIAEAPDFGPEKIALIGEGLSRQQDLSAEERLGFKKFRLREVFAWHDRPLDSSFVAAYRTPEALRVYRNLVRITAEHSIFASLRLIQEQEAATYQMLMNAACLAAEGPPGAGALMRDPASAFESQDLHLRYVFQSHFLAVWLLCLAGFRCITDRGQIREETMYCRMRAGEAKLLAHLEQISFEFQVRRPSVQAFVGRRETPLRYVMKILSVVNSVLRKMYGVEIRRTTKKAGGKSFYIRSTNVGRLFVFIAPNEGPPPVGVLKPYIVSHLAPFDGDNDALMNFLDDCFYDHIATEDELPADGLTPV